MAVVLQSSIFEGEFVPYCTRCHRWGNRPISRDAAKAWAEKHNDCADEAEA